jgi:Pyruvate/2-oxoacid:ferredoxin oxidoreductase gamma subunit
MFQSANMALLGFFAAFGITPFTKEVLEETIRSRVPEKFLAKNLEVFGKGFDAATKMGAAGDRRTDIV